MIKGFKPQTIDCQEDRVWFDDNFFGVGEFELFYEKWKKHLEWIKHNHYPIYFKDGSTE